jgi:large conductance mechanosensitive channel
MVKEFREFILRGNVLDLAVGVIIGVAFGAIVNSLVSDIIMPPIGLIVGNVDFSNLLIVLKEGVPPGPYLSLADAQAAGAVTVNIGLFINQLINFLIIAIVLFLVIRSFNRLKSGFDKPKATDSTTRECPYCISTIAIKATRCPNCTSELP